MCVCSVYVGVCVCACMRVAIFKNFAMYMYTGITLARRKWYCTYDVMVG